MPLIDDNGVFTEDFKTALPTMLGDEHKEFKGFDDTPDLKTLVKRFADNKVFVGKKLENVIQKPAKDAKPEEIAAYRQALGKELGAAESPDKYEFFHADPKTLPEGWNYNAETEKAIAVLAHKHNVPVAFLKEASEAMHKAQFNDYQQAVANQQAAYEKFFSDEVNFLRTNDKWLGDATPKNLRTVLQTIEAFGSDELKAKVKEAKLYDKASLDNLKDWEKAGIPVQNIPFLLNVGSKLLGAQLPQGGGAGGGQETELEKAKRLHPNRSELWPKS